jgi:Protein of unknown function (DUF3810)
MNWGKIKLNKVGLTIILALLALGVRLFSLRPDWVESYYSTGVYPMIGKGMRSIFGWLPFSLGDLLYLLAIAWLVYLLIRLFKKLMLGKINWANLTPQVIKGVNILLIIYIYFNLFWGLNYNRLGITEQLKLTVVEPDQPQLEALTQLLLKRTNSYASAAGLKKKPDAEVVFSGSIENYQKLGNIYPFLQYQPRSVKSSLFGVLGNYMGYTGYYNPFTAEAQINNSVPGFLHYFVSCHEIAHQLGYARENEANFVGFLAARSSSDTAFLYSAYFDMFLYANSALYSMDSAAARRNLKMLSPSVQRDIAELRAYRIKYENPLDKLISIFYDRYLRMNQQPDGQKTYSKVVLWLLAYYDKFGEI